MEVKTYRAKSLQQALQMVRQDLGPDAAVLHTREVGGGILGMLNGPQVEVMASLGVDVPSRFAQRAQVAARREENAELRVPPPVDELDYRTKFREGLKARLDGIGSLVEELSQRAEVPLHGEWSDACLTLLANLLDADVPEDEARDLIEQVRSQLDADDLEDFSLVKTRLQQVLEDEIPCCGPIQVRPQARRIVALVGPTGVGKTTTIAKLAAHYHLREQRRVGLITVDTYRIAAVDQLRTYADIIDLPMEVVATPRELRSAVARLADLDLILLDTAGRSPSDHLKIQELRALLSEAGAHEVHLVLSSVASASSVRRAVEQFADVGVTALLLTKLDEAPGLGGMLSLLRSSRLPLSYITTGQNVPEDFAPAEARALAQRILQIGGE